MTSSHPLGRDSRHSLLELADPHSPSAKSVQYEVWDSRPQLSELTEGINLEAMISLYISTIIPKKLAAAFTVPSFLTQLLLSRHQ